MTFLSTVGMKITNADQLACATLLRKLGGQFLRQHDGAVEIYVWGEGCAVCHDSYEGYIYVAPNSPMQRYITTADSLADENLPKVKNGAVEDGSYILPLIEHWFIIRDENG